MACLAYYDPENYFSETSGYRMFGSAAFGSNGYYYMDPELGVGTNQEATSGRIMWDTDLSDGLDTFVCLTFDANLATGTATLFADDTTTTFNGPAGGTIGQVVIKVGSSVSGVVSWDDIVVGLFKDGVLQETVDVGGSLLAEGSMTNTGIQERIVTVTPEISGCDRAVVAGGFHLEAGAGTCPGPSDLFAQVLILPE